MVAKSLAVIADDDGRRGAAQARGVRIERLVEARHLVIHLADFTEIPQSRVAVDGCIWRRVGCMRIEVVHPEKQRLRRRLTEMGYDGVRRLPRRAFDFSRRQRVVVDVESARETEAPREDERRDEGGRAVAGVLQADRHNRMRVGEVPRVLVHAVASGIQPGHHGAVRRQRFGRRGVGLTEAPAPCRERVEHISVDSGCLRAYGVSARRVERDEQDGGKGCDRCAGARRRRMRAPAGARDGQADEDVNKAPERHHVPSLIVADRLREVLTGHADSGDDGEAENVSAGTT